MLLKIKKCWKLIWGNEMGKSSFKIKNMKIRLAKNKKELEDIFRIREIVFIKGQRVPRKRERDEFDKSAKHVIVFYNKKPIGCARVRFVHKKAKLERIALLKEYRNKGLGKMIMDYLINYCRKKKSKEIVLNSQYYIKDFYRKCGFKTRGKIFMDAGIKHIEMYLK